MQIFFAVQKALFLRELNMRLSQNRMGLFFTFFEPMYQVAFFIIIKVVIFGSESDNFDYTIFLVIVFVPFFMFKNIVTKSIGAFSANKKLFLYKQVKPIDTILARLLLEVFISSMIILAFTMIAFYFEFDTNAQNLGLVGLAYIWLIIFAFALGLFFAVLNTYTKVVANIVSMLLMGLLFISAIFYTVDSLSPDLQAFILYNPLTHFMEMIHAGYFDVLDDTYVDYTYMVLWTITPLTLGLWFYIRLEKRIISL